MGFMMEGVQGTKVQQETDWDAFPSLSLILELQIPVFLGKTWVYKTLNTSKLDHKKPLSTWNSREGLFIQEWPYDKVGPTGRRTEFYSITPEEKLTFPGLMWARMLKDTRAQWGHLVTKGRTSVGMKPPWDGQHPETLDRPGLQLTFALPFW